jgi:uncharacterized membrane protein YsdA (DUF1294 family)/cold shock CspA family protein
MKPNSGIHKGRILEWSKERGFGYVEGGGGRVFLHWREFKERHKRPEVGDVIFFELGQDKQGRSCATEARHASGGGRFRAWHSVVLAGLLALPVVATVRVIEPRLRPWIGGWCLAASLFTFLAYYHDKRMARAKEWRISEQTLHVFALLGGWPGAFLAQQCLRHKSSKGSFQFFFILIVGLYQFVAIDTLRGWPFVRLLLKR